MSQPMEKRQIQARLMERGSNFRQFALSHGYEVRTVTQVVQRWAGHNKLPRGRLPMASSVAFLVLPSGRAFPTSNRY